MKAFAAFLLPAALAAQTINPFPIPLRLDFGESPLFKVVGLGPLASRPATCTQGQIYICIGAGCTNGNNIHYCRATNTWEAQGVAAGGGITSLNALVGATQTFATGTTGTDFGISSSGTTHTFNLPTASGTNRGALSSADWTTFNGKIGGTLSVNRVPFASGASTLTDSANFRFTTDVSFDRLYIAADGVSGFQFKRAAGANTLQLRRHDDAAMGVLEAGILRSKDDSTNDRFVVDPGAATVTIPGSYLDMTGGTMGWPSTTVASLPAAASNTGKVYVVTDSTSAGDCGTGGGSERAICRSNGSAWQSIGRDGGAGALAFSSITGATNTTAAMLCGTGCSLGPTGSGTVTANQILVSAGAAPTADGACEFDSTANAYKCGESGTTYTMWSVAVGAGLQAADSGAQRTVSVDTATIASLDTIQRNTALYLADAGASDAYSASPTPTPTGSIATGSVWTLRANTANTGPSTTDVDAGGALAAVANKYANGSTDTATGDILAGDFLQLVFDGTAMRLPPVIVNSGNVRGKLPLANLTAPSAGQALFSTDGVNVAGRALVASDVTNAFDLTADNALGGHYYSMTEMVAPGNPAADVLRLYVKDDGGVSKLCSKDSAGTEACGLGATGSSHAMLSATHTDSAAGTVTRGDIIVGNATPAWAELALGTAKKVLTSDGTDLLYQFTRLRSHATDCTGLTDGLEGEACFEQDANTLYVCEPTAGGCDTAGEWIQIAGGGGSSTGSGVQLGNGAGGFVELDNSSEPNTGELRLATDPAASATRAVLALGAGAVTGGNANGTLIYGNPSALSGNLIDLRVNGTFKFGVFNGGHVAAAEFEAGGTGPGNQDGNAAFSNNGWVKVRSAGYFGISSTTTAFGAADIALMRNAAGVFEVTDGNANTYRDLALRTVIGNKRYPLPLVGCSGTTATILWDTLASGAPTGTCAAGSTETTMMRGTLDFPDSDGDVSVQQAWTLPTSFDASSTVTLNLFWRAAATSGDVVWQAKTACRANAEVDDVAWNTADVVADTAQGTTNQLNTASITLTTTGCAANERLHLMILRNRTHASDTITGVVSLADAELIYRGAL